jgi:hypothetical protein
MGVESLASPCVTEAATGLADDQARAGEVPQRPEREDRHIRLPRCHHHGVEHEALAARRAREWEAPSDLVAPADQETLPRDHDHTRRVERRGAIDLQPFGVTDVEGAVAPIWS